MKYTGRIQKGQVTIVHVPTGKVFTSWESAIKHEAKN